MFDVVVLGSCMIDFISYVDRMPKCGETIHSKSFHTHFGGKGSNQAIVSARLGCKTAMIGKVGNDEYGTNYIKHFQEEGINTEFLQKAGNHSGIALIVVNSIDGNNQIVINANANEFLSLDDVRRATNVLENSKILICQLETPIDATIEALKTFKGLSILNAAPSVTNLPEIAFKLPKIFCLNEIEAEEFTKVKFNEVSDAKRIIQMLTERGCKTVIITLGKNGAAFNDENEQIYHVPIQEEVQTVVDSTGAGDAFIGALAHFLSKYPKASLLQQIGAAVKIASHSVQFKGTQTSYINFPTIDPTKETFKSNLL